MKKVKQKKIQKIGNFIWGPKKTSSTFERIRFDSDFGLLKATNNYLKAVYSRSVNLKHLDDVKKFVLENERRVDVLLFRCFFCISIAAAQQAIAAGYVYYNHKKCQSPFQLVNPGDIIQISQQTGKYSTKLNPPIHCSVENGRLIYLYSPQYLSVPQSFYYIYTGSVSIYNRKRKKFRKSFGKKSKQ